MPHNPNTWPDLLELLQSWWRGDTPLGAVIMSIVMAGLRIAYFGSGGGWKRKMLEILLCGALTLTFASALEYVGWMSRNEARAFEDMNPKDGLDEMLVSVNASRPAKSTTQENTQDE
ncbi:phage holin, lambda family [Salmonella enterica subsp. enterica serovar Montevideo]|uniref:Phage holin, lambda family n=8 Tax=Salmonella enterica TaxID=28901 RepID=A0A8E6SQI9_SALMO|nr:phage holin, lambda family [Salmonella enterica subsp. enterica serovar Paratyphi B str. CFSAN000540]QVS87558.1 phage holin, lambda family [Salmonella enterica subsp. enterica serovar Montevideo]